jgi:hypothetical protein
MKFNHSLKGLQRFVYTALVILEKSHSGLVRRFAKPL